MRKTDKENEKYQHSAIVFIFFLSGENKICSSAKLGVGLCIFKIEKQTLGLYSSIEYMFVKPNLKQFETNFEQSLN